MWKIGSLENCFISFFSFILFLTHHGIIGIHNEGIPVVIGPDEDGHVPQQTTAAVLATDVGQSSRLDVASTVQGE